MASTLSPRLENLLITYQYWSDRYGSSSLTHDHKKKLEAFHRFKEEASKTGVTEEELAHILEASQQG
jgi:hypothetical protein